MTDSEITAAAFQAYEDALISGAPREDAAWVALDEIERLVRERVRRMIRGPLYG